MQEKIYVIGHKSPDLDSVAGAISYAQFKNKLEGVNFYVPVVAGIINKETEYVLEKFGFEKPKILKDLKNKKVILVDHNEVSQSADGREGAEIVEVLDHHKVDFKYSELIVFKVLPWGASASIIAHCYFKNNIKINKNLAGLILSAILVDTVITKSPTCTEKDKEIIEKLAEIAEIKDWKEYGMEIFKVRSSVSDLSPKEIIKSDFKDFVFKVGRIGIGQVETVNLEELNSLEDNLLKSLNDLKKSGDYHSIILFITDIIKEGSRFLVASEDASGFEKAFKVKLKNNKVYIDKIISRKKQVIPKLTKIFDK